MAMRRWGGLLCIVLFSSLLHAECLPPPIAPSASELQKLQAAAKDQGFLWKISKDGHDSWLYGTIHVNALAGFFPGPKVKQALQRSSILALELDLSDAKTQVELAQWARMGAGQVPTHLQSRLDAQLAQVCLPASMVQTMHPALLLMSIGVLGLRPLGLEAEYGSEPMLLGLAQAGQQKILGLETAAIQMQALLGTDSAVSAEDYELALQQLESQEDQAMALKLVKLWADSDLTTLAQYEQWCCNHAPKQEADMLRLLDERNPGLANGITQLHREGASIFAAVGSLHMVGKNSLLFLLAKQGFKIERIH